MYTVLFSNATRADAGIDDDDANGSTSTRRARQNATGADGDADADADVGERGEDDGRRWTTRGEDGG